GGAAWAGAEREEPVALGEAKGGFSGWGEGGRLIGPGSSSSDNFTVVGKTATEDHRESGDDSVLSKVLEPGVGDPGDEGDDGDGSTPTPAPAPDPARRGRS
ncbi:unnamed protein product, partial [Discosporangium mesarthrocarpum]